MAPAALHPMTLTDLLRLLNPVPKLLFFTSSLLVSAFHNYKAQFLVEKQRIPVERIGLVYSMVGVNFVGSLFWTRLADRFSKHRQISYVAPWLYALSACLFLVKWSDGEDDVVSMERQYWVTGVTGLSHFFSSAIFPLLDAMVFAMLLAPSPGDAAGQEGNRALYGHQRVFSALANPVASGISFLLLRTPKEYNALFVCMFVMAALYSLIVYFGVPADLQVGAKEKDEERGWMNKKPSLLDVIRITSPALPVLLLFVLSSGYLRALMNIYQNYMVDKLLMNSDRLGPLILSLVRPFSEAYVFFFSKSLIEKVGVSGALVMSQVAGIARVLGYGLMPKREQSVVYIAAPLEFLKGINSGLIISAASRMGNQMAPPGGHGTIHGLLAGTYTGLSMALGGILSSCMLMAWRGDGIDHVPSDSDNEMIYANLQRMFLVSAAGTTVVLIIFIASFRMFVRLNGSNAVHQ